MTDYIKRDAVSDYLEQNNMPWRDWVKDIPSADVRENIKGEWRFIEGDILGMYDCSNCGHLSFNNSNYRPNCGAQMMRGEA